MLWISQCIVMSDPFLDNTPETRPVPRLHDASAHKTPESEEKKNPRPPLFLPSSPSPFLCNCLGSRDGAFVIPPRGGQASAGRQLVYPAPLTTWQEALAWLACLLFSWLDRANEAVAARRACRITPAARDKHKQDPLSPTISLRRAEHARTGAAHVNATRWTCAAFRKFSSVQGDSDPSMH